MRRASSAGVTCCASIAFNNSTFAATLARSSIGVSPPFCVGRHWNRALVFKIEIHRRRERVRCHFDNFLTSRARGNGFGNIAEGHRKTSFVGFE